MVIENDNIEFELIEGPFSMVVDELFCTVVDAWIVGSFGTTVDWVEDPLRSFVGLFGFDSSLFLFLLEGGVALIGYT